MYKSLPTIKSFGPLATVSLAMLQLGGHPCKVALVNNPKDPTGWQLWKITYKGKVTELDGSDISIGPLKINAPKIHRTLLVPADGIYAVVNRLNGNIYRGADHGFKKQRESVSWLEANYGFAAGNYAVVSTGNLGIMNPARGGWKGSWEALLGRQCVAINLVSGKLAWYRSRVDVGTPIYGTSRSIVTVAFTNPMVLLWTPDKLLKKLHLIAYLVRLSDGKILGKMPAKLLQGSEQRIAHDFFFPLYYNPVHKMNFKGKLKGDNLIVTFDDQKVEVEHYENSN